MKRIISIILIILLTLSITSCKSKQGEKNAATDVKTSYKDSPTYIDEKYSIYDLQGGSYVDLLPITATNLEELIKICNDNDIFVGKILAAEKVLPKLPLYYLHKEKCTKGEDCEELFSLDKKYEELFELHSEIYLLTVEVEKLINATFATEKTTIYVLHQQEREFEYPYVVGESYLMEGMLTQYGDKTVLLRWPRFFAAVDSEGNLEGLGYDSVVKIMNDVGTLENFQSNEYIKQLSQKDFYVSDGYNEEYNISYPTDLNENNSDPNVQRFIADAKKALIIENNYMMDVHPQVYDWPEGYEKEAYEKYYPYQ